MRRFLTEIAVLCLLLSACGSGGPTFTLSSEESGQPSDAVALDKSAMLVLTDLADISGEWEEKTIDDDTSSGSEEDSNESSIIRTENCGVTADEINSGALLIASAGTGLGIDAESDLSVEFGQGWLGPTITHDIAITNNAAEDNVENVRSLAGCTIKMSSATFTVNEIEDFDVGDDSVLIRIDIETALANAEATFASFRYGNTRSTISYLSIAGASDEEAVRKLADLSVAKLDASSSD